MDIVKQIENEQLKDGLPEFECRGHGPRERAGA